MVANVVYWGLPVLGVAGVISLLSAWIAMIGPEVDFAEAVIGIVVGGGAGFLVGAGVLGIVKLFDWACDVRSGKK